MVSNLPVAADDKVLTAAGDNAGEDKAHAENKKQISSSDFHNVSFIVNILCEHEEVSTVFWAFFSRFLFGGMHV